MTLPLAGLALLGACGDDTSTPTSSVAGAGTGGASGASGAGAGGTAGAGAAGTAGAAGAQGDSASNKLDLLLVIDNSASMADKQEVLAQTLARSVGRLINPRCVVVGPDGKATPAAQQPGGPKEPCVDGAKREFSPIEDLHLGVLTSSLGGHGSDYCTDIDPAAPNQDTRKNFTQNDRARLINRSPRPEGSTAVDFGPAVKTYKDAGFFAWDPGQKADPPGEGNASNLIDSFAQVVRGADQIGCGYEASLEAWYRFLIDPTPPLVVAPNPAGPSSSPVVDGTDDVLLAQRAEFLRPDSLVAIINLSDENDCSIIDGVLPADVCDEPELDKNGNPTGCKVARAGWPVGYAEGNFSNWKQENGRVSGSPFPANHLAALQRINGAPFHLSSGTPECADDPYSPACSSCYTGGFGCQPNDDSSDAPNLRCWNQKQRFGTDFLYPLRRYSDGLLQVKIYDRNGFLVTNPLFDDLPYKKAVAAGQQPSKPKAQLRPYAKIFYMPIVGVPWQDIARNPGDLGEGYRPTVGGQEAGVDWDLILGNPFALNKAQRKGPTDPLMVEAIGARDGKHPITGEAISTTGWNSINGHEWTTGTSDLQFACIFELPKARDCSDPVGSCDCTADQALGFSSPLCEKPTDGKGDGKATTTQYFAKAYPGTRFLQVARDFGTNAVLASICTPNANDPSKGDFGYQAAFASLIERMSPQIAP